MPRQVNLLWAMLLFGCGGAEVVPEKQIDESPGVTQSGIEVIRASFDAMGGLERLRLNEGKVSIQSAVSTGKESFQINIVAGPKGKWRLDYAGSEVSYVYSDGLCHRIVYGIPTKCMPSEEVWLDVTTVLQALLFPGGDIANLKATFKTKDDIELDGALCSVVEIRPQNSNIRLRAAYDKQTKLLSQASFLIDFPLGKKTKVTAKIGDWREVEGVRVPFSRIVFRDETMIWKEDANAISHEMYDERSFALPVAPITSELLNVKLPQRRVVRTELYGVEVEVPAPFTTIGGGPVLDGEVIRLPEADTVRSIVKDKLSRSPWHIQNMMKGIAASDRKVVSIPHIALFEHPLSSEEPVLMMIYIVLPSE